MNFSQMPPALWKELPSFVRGAVAICMVIGALTASVVSVIVATRTAKSTDLERVLDNLDRIERNSAEIWERSRVNGERIEMLASWVCQANMGPPFASNFPCDAVKWDPPSVEGFRAPEHLAAGTSWPTPREAYWHPRKGWTTE